VQPPRRRHQLLKPVEVLEQPLAPGLGLVGGIAGGQPEADAGRQRIAAPLRRRVETDAQLRLPAAALLRDVNVTRSAGLDAAAPEQAHARMACTIARLGDLRGKRPIVQRHQQRLETRRQRLDGRLRPEMAERGELGAAESSERKRSGPGGARRRPCASFRGR
jgi:hypothetical protein